MTVIAYRDGVLAGDSCWSESGEGGSGLINNLQNKVIRLPSGALYGGAGAPDDRELLRLLKDVRQPKALPSAKRLSACEQEGVEAILVLPDKTVWLINTGKSGCVVPLSTEFTAVGCGAQIAIGAMAFGATAEAAAHIACAWNVNCRPPVHTLRLKGNK